MTVRTATEADLPAILAIYNDAVLHSTAIWNETPVDLENRRGWFEARRAAGFPVLVAEEAGRVAGYGSFGDFRPFEGYRVSVEHSLYVAADARGRGHGAALLAALIEAARGLNKRVMIGGIDGANAPSIALHVKFGFVEVGRLPGVGEKFGRPLDLVLMQKNL
ncbi:MAG: N-acetyltransferase [Bradyrhizobiaceae bacterium]|nr:N-acetyltransferase [Bradyrhizobiaceae bacterium]